MQYPEDGDRQTIWHHEDWSRNHVNNHSGRREVTRNLSEPSDQTLMHIDVYADYLRTKTPQTPSRALKALPTRGGGKSIGRDNRYTEAYGPHEVMVNIDGINIYSKTMITCDENLAGQTMLAEKN